MTHSRRGGPVLTILAALLLAGCAGPPAGPPPDPSRRGDPLAVEVLELDADGYARTPVAALSGEPIALRRFAGWFGQAEAGAEPGPAEPGRTRLAVAAGTGCRTPTGVEVRRVGDDLRVRFTGGEDHPECYRPVGPSAVLELAAADVAGVRTVDGRPTVSPDGPGTLIAFDPVPGGAPSMREVTEEVPGAGPPAPGAQRFEFVRTGCRDTGAVLLPGASQMGVELTGGAGAVCDAPEWYRAVFEVPAEFVTDSCEPVPEGLRCTIE